MLKDTVLAMLKIQMKLSNTTSWALYGFYCWLGLYFPTFGLESNFVHSFLA